jgi:hypothetical protein
LLLKYTEINAVEIPEIKSDNMPLNTCKLGLCLRHKILVEVLERYRAIVQAPNATSSSAYDKIGSALQSWGIQGNAFSWIIRYAALRATDMILFARAAGTSGDLPKDSDMLDCLLLSSKTTHCTDLQGKHDA